MLGIPFEFIWLIGIIVLGAAIFFGTRRRPLSRAERERSEQVARENWGKENMR
jgi:hypothetical protein